MSSTNKIPRFLRLILVGVGVIAVVSHIYLLVTGSVSNKDNKNQAVVNAPPIVDCAIAANTVHILSSQNPETPASVLEGLKIAGEMYSRVAVENSSNKIDTGRHISSKVDENLQGILEILRGMNNKSISEQAGLERIKTLKQEIENQFLTCGRHYTPELTK